MSTDVHIITAIQEYHQWLKSFGKEYRKLGCRHLSAKPYGPTLKRLRELGHLKCVYKNPRTLDVKREAFNTTKQRRKFTKFGTCFLCYQKARLVRHHVVWLSNGGGNEKQNIVLLCEKCHAEIHPWLKASLKSNRTPTIDTPVMSIKYTPNFDILFA